MPTIDLFRLCISLLVAVRAPAADSFLPKQEGASLFTDLEAVLGPHSLQGRVARLENRLLPIFLALPKSPRGVLAHSTTRYALHRTLVDMYGWSIPGLEANKTTFNTTSLVGSGILRGLLPAHLEDLFGKHIDAEGFQLRDLVLLASTIEHLVHEDQKSILRKACEFLNLPTVGPMGENAMSTIIALYMVSFLQTFDLSRSSVKDAYARLKGGFTEYPSWTDAAMLLLDEREGLAFNERARANPFVSRESSLQVAERIVEQVAGHFARSHAEPDCQEIKEDLLAYERGDSGRIRLKDFYRASLEARFFYVETKEYLRAAGFLDESDSAVGPQVVVPNYVLGKSNCLAHANTYSICCFNECEELFGKLERGIAAPQGLPEDVLSLVAGFSSSTVQGSRNLSQLLVRRLHEVAAANDGAVLLHGRLFAQWMHQAFPRECPYPHPVGTTTSLGPSAWAKLNGQPYRIDENWTRNEIRSQTLSFIDTLYTPADSISTSNEDMDLMWTPEEELLVEPTRSLTARLLALVRPRRASLSVLVPGALFAMLALTRKAPPDQSGNTQKYFV